MKPTRKYISSFALAASVCLAGTELNAKTADDSAALLSAHQNTTTINHTFIQQGEFKMSENTTNDTDSLWEKTKEASANAWEATKETTGDAWDATKEGSEKAWDKTKEVSGNAWEKTKEGAAKAKEAVTENSHDANVTNTEHPSYRHNPGQPAGHQENRPHY